MSDATPTRSAVLKMKDERHAMREGYVFLDEKCLLLAGEILRELGRYATLRAAVAQTHAAAAEALRSAIGRHGLQGLQVYPASPGTGAIRYTRRGLMGVHLQDAVWAAPQQAGVPPTAARSPEAEACRAAFSAVLPDAVSLAAVIGNLERLFLEYRRSVRRARALQDVLLPELDRTLSETETRLEELEQEDAVSIRHGARGR